MNDETPLFALQNEVQREPRQQSMADAERKTRIAYHRRSRTSAPATCDDCIDEHVQRGGTPLRRAVYLRKQGGVERVLCYEHKQERQDSEWLNAGK